MMSVIESHRFVEDAQDVLNICVLTRSSNGERGTAVAIGVADDDVVCRAVDYNTIVSVGDVVVLK